MERNAPDSCGKSESKGDPAGDCFDAAWQTIGRNGGISENSWNVFRKNRFYLIINKVDWNGRHETPAGNASPGETPQAQKRRGGSRTARGKRVPGVEINGSSFTNPQKNCRQKEFYLTVKTKLIGTEGTRLLREMRVQGRPRRRKSAEEAPGPPAESECLEWRSTIRVLQTLKKIIDKRSSISLLKQS